MRPVDCRALALARITERLFDTLGIQPTSAEVVARIVANEVLNVAAHLDKPGQGLTVPEKNIELLGELVKGGE